MFRELDATETEQFKQFARDNKPPETLGEFLVMHPVCRDEWCEMLDNDFHKIYATEEVEAMAKTVVSVQDACNPIPVMKLLERVSCHFHHNGNGKRRTGGTAWAKFNPLTLAIIDKLCSLSQLKQDFTKGHQFHSACDELAKGNDIHWHFPV